MNECVKKGIHIRIIHNIDRGLVEMTDAIINWLPLYMSGMIESFYCIKPGSGRFSHTIFLNPGNFCIEAAHVIGMEAAGIYRFHTSGELLSQSKGAFDKLMEMSRPLVRISSQREAAIPAGITVEQSDIKIISLPDAPFDNMNIFINENAVRVDRIAAPCLSIIFTHPLMCRAFRAYAEQLARISL